MVFAIFLYLHFVVVPYFAFVDVPPDFGLGGGYCSSSALLQQADLALCPATLLVCLSHLCAGLKSLVTSVTGLTHSLTIKRISKQLALQYFWVSYLTVVSLKTILQRQLNLPTLNFRWEKQLSSISTSMFLPPMTQGAFNRDVEHISRI